MKKIIIIIVGILLIGAGLFLGKDYLPLLTSDDGQLKVETQPKTTVFVNGENKGSTPYQGKFSPGSYEVKLLPENETTTLTWQQQVAINKGVQTYITATLGTTDATSSWEIVTLEQLKRGETELSIFSQTDSSEIFINDERKGTTPLSFKDITTGMHGIRLTAPGFTERIVQLKVTPGYKIGVTSHLASLAPQPPGTPDQGEQTTPSEQSQVTVTILDTPTGWLRVRAEPATSGEEIGRVTPGEEYPYLEEQEGWFKIEYEKGKEGWISGQYAEKTEETKSE
ncbi:SH3 domain-containing protein [Candidatus Roizmanbacteria bacterium]|nr:SH3 domain-containing protein [Candidatus Roizmanbacteria bacterium]